MKYEVKGLTSYGVYDGDRLLGSYESEKTAELIAEALNEEEGRRALYASAVGIAQAKVGTGPNDVTKSIYADRDRRTSVVLPNGNSDTNGHDKETI